MPRSRPGPCTGFPFTNTSPVSGRSSPAISRSHPLVELTVMRQPAKSRTLVHLVNLSGHSQTGYFPPIEMRDIRIELEGTFRLARSAVLGTSLPIRPEG